MATLHSSQFTVNYLKEGVVYIGITTSWKILEEAFGTVHVHDIWALRNASNYIALLLLPPKGHVQLPVSGNLARLDNVPALSYR